MKQASVKAHRNETAGIVGTGEHDTKFGCESVAGGCRLASVGATRPAGSDADRWAGKEIRDSEGSSSCSTAGGGSRASSRQLVPAGKFARGKLRQPKGVSKSVQQRAEERREIDLLLGAIRDVRRLTPHVQALAGGEEMIAKLQARVLELQAGLHQDGH